MARSCSSALFVALAAAAASCARLVAPGDSVAPDARATDASAVRDVPVTTTGDAAPDGPTGPLACASAPVVITDTIDGPFRVHYSHGAYRLAWVATDSEGVTSLIVSTLAPSGHIATNGLHTSDCASCTPDVLRFFELPDGFGLVTQSEARGPTEVFRFDAAGALVGRASFDSRRVLGARYAEPNLDLVTTESFTRSPTASRTVAIERRDLRDGTLRFSVSSPPGVYEPEELSHIDDVTWLANGFAFAATQRGGASVPMLHVMHEGDAVLTSVRDVLLTEREGYLASTTPVQRAGSGGLDVLISYQGPGTGESGNEMSFVRFGTLNTMRSERVPFPSAERPYTQPRLLALPRGYAAAWVDLAGRPRVTFAGLNADGSMGSMPRALGATATTREVSALAMVGGDFHLGIAWMQTPGRSSTARATLYFACPEAP